MRWLLIVTVFILAYGWDTDEVTLQIPPPEKKLSMGAAKDLYHSFELFISRYLQKMPLPLPDDWVRCLERILLDFPDERFLHRPKGLGLPERIERAYVRSWLAASYKAEGRWDEALSLWMQDFFIGWIENLEKKVGLLYGFPAFPFPDPFRDPEKAIESFANFVRKMQKEGGRFPPLIFVRGWPIRARWKGNSLDDALISLNDFAYALGGENWRDVIQHDWKNWRFTLSVKGKTVTFAFGSQKALVAGKESLLRHKVERSYYDLYVPLIDLVKLIGGNLRPPKPDELQPLRRYLPVQIWVVDLN